MNQNEVERMNLDLMAAGFSPHRVHENCVGEGILYVFTVISFAAGYFIGQIG